MAIVAERSNHKILDEPVIMISKKKVQHNCLLIHLLITLLCTGFHSSFGQSNIPNLTPIPPSSFQFVKYGEIPVSMYTGIPNITVPIYQIKEGDIEFEIGLSYHAGGIRVSEEASWVGLGWNLDVGNITQIVNDRDDLGDFQKLLIDYYAYGVPARTVFPTRHPYPYVAVDPPVFGISNGITKEAPLHNLIVYTDYYAPINGSYNSRFQELFNAPGTGEDHVDSEPDVFKANFHGHYLEFIRNFKGSGFVVLNKKNYKIQIIAQSGGTSTWKIVAPDGFQYFFDEVEEVRHKYAIPTLAIWKRQKTLHRILSVGFGI